jgi:hypothetical protein
MLKTLSLTLALLSLVGCTENVTESVAAVDGAIANTDYFIVRQDTRKCVAPLCGGLWVRKANEVTTVCADGQPAAECYVAEASYGGLHLDMGERGGFDARLRGGQAVVRAQLSAKDFGEFGSLGVLKVSEAWEARTSATPSGSLFAVSATGIVCIQAPCPTLKVSPLNHPEGEQQITDLDLRALGLEDTQVGELLNIAYSDKLLVAGEIQACGGAAVALIANQAFTKIVRKQNVVGDWSFVAADQTHYSYSFSEAGTFQAVQEPGCLFTRPACAVRQALLEGVYTVDGTKLSLVYTSSARHGQKADFVITGQGASMRLVGEDFGVRLRLRRVEP